MQRFELALSPEEASGEQSIRKAVSARYGRNYHFRILKRSIDARSRNVKIRLLIEVFSDSSEQEVFQKRKWQNVSNAEPVLIAGCGPAGLFAAIRLIECGFKPVIIERGKDVRNRRRDLAAINKQGKVNPESNYCFGEGGAGTYSDGKLYTRSNKRGDIQAMLNTFIEFGAAPDIAIDAHPHIGTNKLPGIISAMRQMILECGGEILFNTKLVDINCSGGKFESITVRGVNDAETII
ncbi:MAG: FAD-binding protein, partial [Bacteroidetes bacterium]|nr:FAD-binding protein [Bacteroidota bacterium]